MSKGNCGLPNRTTGVSLPLYYKTCRMPPDIELALSSLQWIDFIEPTYEEAFLKLMHALQYDVNLETARRREALIGDFRIYICCLEYIIFWLGLHSGSLRSSSLTAEG